MGAVALRLGAPAAALLLPGAALAHAVDAVQGPRGAEPWLIVVLAFSVLLYGTGVARLWAQAGRSRGITPVQVTAFALGWATLVAALASPLDEVSAQLFAAHMVQHELLMIVAAPLLVLGRPLAAWTWALAPRQRRAVALATRWRWLAWLWGRITQPLAAWALHALALWLWHVPQLFDAALHHEWVHILQHASFLGTALLFWWTVLGADPRSSRSGAGLASLFTTMMHTGALGALLTFATSPWYEAYAVAGGAYGLTPVEDQQLGGLVMWIPGGTAYLIAGLVLVGRLLARRPLTRASATRPVPTR
jgi:putative membrane protein